MLEDTRTPQYPYFLRSRLKLKKTPDSRGVGRECRKERLSATARGGPGGARNNVENGNDESSLFLQWGCEDKNYPETPCTSLCNVMDTLSLTKGRRIRNRKCAGPLASICQGSYASNIDSGRRIGTPNGIIGAKMRRVCNTIHKSPTDVQSHDQGNIQQPYPSSFSPESHSPESSKLTLSRQRIDTVTEAKEYIKNKPQVDVPDISTATPSPSSSISPTPQKEPNPSLVGLDNKRSDALKIMTTDDCFQSLKCSQLQNEYCASISPISPDFSDREYIQLTATGQDTKNHKTLVDRHSYMDIHTPERSIMSKSDLLLDNSSYANISAPSTSDSQSISSSMKILNQKIRLGTFSTLSSLKSATPDSSESTPVDDDELSESISHSHIINDLKGYFQNLPSGLKDDELSLYDEAKDEMSSENTSNRYSDPMLNVRTEKSFFYVGEDSGRVVKSKTEYPGAIIVTKVSRSDQQESGDTITENKNSNINPPHTNLLTPPHTGTQQLAESSDPHTPPHISADVNHYVIAGSKENFKLSSSHPYSFFLNKNEDFKKCPWTPMKKALKRSLNSRIAYAGTDDIILCELSARYNKIRRTNLRRCRGLSFPPESNSSSSLNDVIPDAHLSRWTSLRNSQTESNDMFCNDASVLKSP